MDDCCKKAPRRARYVVIGAILLLGLGLAAASGELVGRDGDRPAAGHCGGK